MRVALLLPLLACASGPTARHLQKSPGYRDAVRRLTRVAVIADAAIVTSASSKDPDGRPYIPVEESRAMGARAAAGAAGYLRRGGYTVVGEQAAFVGGYFSTKGGPVEYVTAPRIGGEVGRGPAPLDVAAPIATDGRYREALLDVVRAVFRSIQQGAFTKSVPSDYLLAGEHLARSMALVAERNGTPALLVIVVAGQHQSMGSRIASGVGGFLGSFGLALATAGTTGVAVIATPGGGGPRVDAWCGLVDLRSGEVLWANGLGFKKDPLDEAFYREEWPGEMLHFLVQDAAAGR